MMKFYRLEARRILAGQKKLSTILITPARAAVFSARGKRLTGKAIARTPVQRESRRGALVEKLRMGVDNMDV